MAKFSVGDSASGLKACVEATPDMAEFSARQNSGLARRTIQEQRQNLRSNVAANMTYRVWSDWSNEGGRSATAAPEHDVPCSVRLEQYGREECNCST
jgi:hypothetical protein